MGSIKSTKYEPLSASPVKSFFFTMLTRDIPLEDAILDLLDNCVDGILRSGECSGPKPYQGYWAAISFNADSFEISDNCGGIPWSLHDYAFRMGRAADHPPIAPGSVGAYGIGMKRAIFKMGKQCLISSQNGSDQYEVEISPEWLLNESNWNLNVTRAKNSMKEDGTIIVVGDLNPGITEQFGQAAQSFTATLQEKISTQYSYIIDKGFIIKINGSPVESRAVQIVFDKTDAPSIRPYIFKTTVDDVDVFLAVGFTRGLPSENEIADEQEGTHRSSEEAGWTILCNDRAVLFCDRTEQTGWGDANVPRYHTQFIAIAGIVEFRSKDAKNLPTTTTKRGIDASSPLYLQVKNKMREGMKIFTDYTNKWKGREDESNQQIRKGAHLSLIQMKTETKKLPFTTLVKSFPPGFQYKPKLPFPEQLAPTKRRISFVREISKIRVVGEYFENPDMPPSEVGARCFDTIYEEAR